jgi:hypothetical protein
VIPAAILIAAAVAVVVGRALRDRARRRRTDYFLL